jgi:predicted negative regulator of RcsB-dependent stress response
MLAFSNQDNKSVRGYASRLIGDYKTTVYADVARLTLAKLYVDKEHYIKAQQELSYVAQHSRMVALKQIARIRLARLLTAEKSYQSALEELKQVNDMAFMPVVNELQGDILEQLGDSEKALDFYQKALNAHQANGMANLFLEMKTNELVALIQPKPRSSTNKEV